MFSIFRRPGKIHVDCFTYMPTLTDLFPVLLAEERIPSWHKGLSAVCKSPSGPMKGTMKTCPGVNDLFRTGIILQSWCDMYINWENPGNSGMYWEPQDKGESHHPLQWGDTPQFKNYFHFKFLSPWKFVEKTGIKWIMMNTFWHDTSQRYIVPAGMVEYKYQHTTNVNMFIPKASFPKNLTINAGKEISHIIPLSEKDIVLHQHEISETEYIRKYMGIPFSFTSQYYKKKKILQAKGV